MNEKLLKNSFLEFCSKKKFEKNNNQLEIIDLLENFLTPKKSLLRFLSKSNQKICFYLYGDVGSGKTMLLNFFYNQLDIKKYRSHFNEFMINFHDYRHKNKEKNSIYSFVKDLKKKCRIIYLDEFQETNIVDAMILGKLFETIFKENLKIIVTSNTKIENLYKDGLQREQFVPFIEIMKNMCNEYELNIKHDYRKFKSNIKNRFFYPLNEESNFKINQMFRRLTKGKKHEVKKLNINGREFIIKNYFDKIARFDFTDLCDKNIGSEDYIEITKFCKLVVIENIPNFNEENVDKQQRFITLIDIFYENRVFLITSSISSLENFISSQSLKLSFKRTLSRLHELTSLNFNSI